MHFLFAKNFLWYLALLIVGGGTLWYGYTELALKNEAIIRESTTVALATISQNITVSGRVEAEQVARLGFPVTGTVKHVLRTEGEVVSEGDIIASLTNYAMIAEYNAALEQVRYLEQVKQELVRGPLETKRAVAEADLAVAEANLAAITREYEQAIQNARQALLSTDLSAYPTNPINNDLPPTISGSYLCDEEGRYEITLFSSLADSGRSYYLSGLQSGTYEANIDTSAPLGDCGLYILFSDGEIYRNSTWIVEIPNRRSSSYVALRNAYDLLVAQRDAAVKSATEAITLASNKKNDLLAPASPEVIGQADANIATTKARLDAIEARIADYTIRAPFPGVVTSVDMKVGEAVGPTHTITMVYEGDYELKARIPEIDIKKVTLTNQVVVRFDADPETSFDASLTFISPLSTDVSGVAYYDAIITLTNPPDWLREGLNADVTIENERKESVPTIPKRYLITEDNRTYVLIPAGTTTIKQPVTTGLVGTDGQVEVADLPIGTIVVRP